MNKALKKIIIETSINSELFPMDFYYTDIITDEKDVEKKYQRYILKNIIKNLLRLKTHTEIFRK